MSEMKTNKIIQGDCLEVMKLMESNSVDTIITDPPYGLSFMGKKWDYDVPGVEIWKEALRVLKPGGTALIFAGSRTQHRMAVNVEDAGFILKDTIMWLYGSGFPKATDISKQLDKGVKRKVIGQKIRGSVEKAKQSGSTFAKADANKNNKDIFGYGIEDLTEPSTTEAKLWNGWKSHGLKPAYEPIIVAMKPNDGTYANNALKWGVSGLNIDGGRIEGNNKKWNKPKGGIWHKSEDNDAKLEDNPQGRFPANIIISEEVAPLIDEQSGISGQGHWSKTKTIGFGKFGNGKSEYSGVGIKDKTKHGASRFFYVAKASRKERNMGLEGFEEQEGIRTNAPRENEDVKTPTRANHHPTVKPLKLMRYLVKLTKTPTGGVVLDPFLGSGTTAMACKLEGRDYVGIEKNPEYIKIAEARIKAVEKPLL